MLKEFNIKEESGQQWIESTPDNFEKVVEKLKTLNARLITISGVDDQKDFKVFYHFDLKGKIVHLTVPLSTSNLKIRSITNTYPNADLYERELAEMFNIKVIGHPHLKPLFLSKDMEGKAPLRKSFKGLKD